jgi:hypothetical protein
MVWGPILRIKAPNENRASHLLAGVESLGHVRPSPQHLVGRCTSTCPVGKADGLSAERTPIQKNELDAAGRPHATEGCQQHDRESCLECETDLYALFRSENVANQSGDC